MLLQLSHVYKIYGELHAVDDLSLDVERDKFLTAEEAVEYGLVDDILTSLKD